jgi:hypothetical protein
MGAPNILQSVFQRFCPKLYIGTRDKKIKVDNPKDADRKYLTNFIKPIRPKTNILLIHPSADYAQNAPLIQEIYQEI